MPLKTKLFQLMKVFFVAKYIIGFVTNHGFRKIIDYIGKVRVESL